MEEQKSSTEEFKELKEQISNYRGSGVCPNCGYCPHCGRRNDYNYPVYPSYTYYGHNIVYC